MIHKFDLYASTITQNSEGRASKTYALSKDEIPCNFQPATSDVVQDYERNDEVVSASVFLIDVATFDLATPENRIVFNGTNYEIIGKQNLANLNRVYRIDVSEEIQ